MAWIELASAVWSTGSSFGTGTFSARRFLYTEFYVKSSGNPRPTLQFNSDCLSNYSNRVAANGSACDTTTFNQCEIRTHIGTSVAQLTTAYIANDCGDEKLVAFEGTGQNTAGASNIVDRIEGTGKWDNTAQITEIDVVDVCANAFTAGRITVWGTD